MFTVEDDIFKRTKAPQFIKLIESFSANYADRTISELLADILDKSGYEEALRTEGSQERLDNIAELKQSVYDYERTCGEESMLEQENLMTPAIHRALEQALTVSVENLDTIPGRTLIAVDVSGSMGSYISRKSTVMCSEIAGLLGAMSSRICEDAAVCYFDYSGGWSCVSNDGYIVEHYGKYDSILEICKKHSFNGGGTQMDLPMKYALEEDRSARLKPFDRVIYFSDNVCNSYSYGIKTVQSMVDKYRNTYNPDFWVHGVDLQGYGTQQFCGKNFNLIAGWSEKVLDFILLAEKGIGSLVQTIEEYQMK